MDKIFLAIYHFFRKRKWALYLSLSISTLFFAFFATKIRFEENIFKLLPQTDKATECGIAFGDIKVKDKLFIQFAAKKGEKLTTDELSSLEEEFLTELQAEDTATKYIGSCLYKIDLDDAMNAMYYAFDHIQGYANDGLYAAFDTMLSMEQFEKISSHKEQFIPDIGGNFKLINGYFFSKDSTLAISFIAPTFNSIDSKQGTKLIVLIENLSEKFTKEHPELDIMFHGPAVSGANNSRQIKKDVTMTVTISLIAILFIIGICFKRLRSLLELVAPVVYGTICALACVYLIKGSMSIIAIGIGAMILGAALSYCLHVLTHHKYVGAPERVIREQATPVCLGCITTIGAFLGLLLTSSELLNDFGLFATFALLGTTFFALVFLPHFLEIKTDIKKNEKAFAAINKINNYPLHRNKFVVGIVSVVCLASLFIAHRVGFDSDFKNIGYRSKDEVRARQVYDEKINHGLQSKYYAAFATNLDDAILISRQINKKMSELKREGLVTKYSSISDFMATLEEQKTNIAKWKEYWTPEKEEQVGNLLEQAAEKFDWDESLDIPGTFHTVVQADCEAESIDNADAIPEALMSNFMEKTSDGYLVFTSALMEGSNTTRVGDSISKLQGAVVIDPYFYTGDMIEIIHSDFNTVLLISSIFVFIVLLLSFRSIFTSVLAFLPMFFSWFVVEAVMYLFGIEFNLISIMISSFIFGIGVDYSIFMVDGLINKSLSGSDNLLTYHKAAILFSIFALLVVTASLLLAKHPAIHSVGVSTLIGMCATVLITYAIQPLLFKLLLGNSFIKKKILHQK